MAAAGLNPQDLDPETRKLLQEALRRGLTIPIGPQPERTDLLAFCQAAYPGYEVAPHLLRLTGLLEQVARGNVRRLLVSMPPRHGKSTTASILFPAWFLGQRPDSRVVLTSYSADLAQRFSRQVREVVTGEEYRRVFPGIGLAPDSRSVEAWDIGGRRGGLKAVGVGGPLTGHGADLLIIDDFFKNAEESNSATVRQSVWDWFTTTAFTRLEPGGAIVVCAARWHEDDLIGRLLVAEAEAAKSGHAGERWEVLHLPALDDQDRPLWPERYDGAALGQIRVTLGSRDWEALYQGRPQAPGGGMLKRSWFRTVTPANVPPLRNVAVGVDLAVTAKSRADYTVALPLGVDKENNYYLFRPARGQWEWPDARREIMTRVRTMPQCRRVGMEKVAFQAAAAQELRREPQMAGYSIVDVPADRDKVTRAGGWSPLAEQGRMYLVDDGSGWHEVFLAEAEQFPQGRNDDLVDAVGIGMEMIRASSSHAPVVGGTNRVLAALSQVHAYAGGAGLPPPGKYYPR